MLADADLAKVAEFMVSHRATLLLALAEGRALAASELAARAGISPSLTSAHLAKLLDGGLVSVQQRGRRRHYRLAGHHVAEVIEAMLTIAPVRTATTLREAARGEAIRHARTCYDHLAGTLGVALTDALQRQRVIEPVESSCHLTTSGQARLEDLGLDIAELRRHRRPASRAALGSPRPRHPRHTHHQPRGHGGYATSSLSTSDDDDGMIWASQPRPGTGDGRRRSWSHRQSRVPGSGIGS